MLDVQTIRALNAALEGNPDICFTKEELDVLLDNLTKAGTYRVYFFSDDTLFGVQEVTAGLYVNRQLAPSTSVHGVLMEVFGVGILLTGESGVGKSETAMELIKRGHRLVADDSVILKEVAHELTGTAPERIRYFMELRGIGIINVRSMYGSGSILDEKTVQLVIELEPRQVGKSYDRMGDDAQSAEYLGVKLPKITSPVSPGRNLAIIIEVAARNHRLKSMGYDAAEELIHRSMGR